MTTKTTCVALSAASAGLAILAMTCPASAECHMRKLAELPITMEGLRPIVHVTINGQLADMIVDTGAFHSMLTPEAARLFKVKGEPMEGILVQGVAASSFNSAGRAELDLAGAPIKGMQFVIGASGLEEGHVGLLGQNVFSLFDVEYDLANGVIRLFDPKGCGNADLGYWANGASIIPIEPITAESVGIMGRAKVDGQSIRFEIDTGAPTSILTRGAAKRAGLPVDGAEVVAGGEATGVGGGVVETWIAPASFEIGYESLAKTRLRFGKVELEGIDMLLGDDFMLSHRVLVSNLQHKMYFTYNGGPVFQLKQLRHVEAAGPAAAATGPTADGLGAEALTRRADASLARGDAASAITDLTRAITAEASAKRYSNRAEAYLRNGQVREGKADLDKALELSPDDAGVLLMRGSYFLANHDEARAQADFDRARKGSPASLQLPLDVAKIYEANDRPAKALAEYDAWLAAHPQGEQAPWVLHGRCRLRVMEGRDLGKALDDCNAAIRKVGKVAELLETRGLVYLRLDRPKEAAADFDAALKLQPRSAWSLYGRGLAQQKLGASAAGDADIKAALQIQPGLTRELTKAGFVGGIAGAASQAAPGKS